MRPAEKRRAAHNARMGQPVHVLDMARLKALAERENAPRCHAHRKDGTPCGNLAVRVGVCWAHGAATPTGRQWHRVQPARSIAKIESKARTLELRRKKLAARIAAMTPDELAVYQKWSQAMRPGTPAERAQRRRDVAMREEIARLMSQDPERTPELMALDREIDRLKQEIAASQQEGKQA